MAQTESLLLIGLGFVLALLLVFAFGQSFWSLAARLARRKQAKQLPSNILALRAERDSMRAEHATLTRRLEALEDAARETAVMKDAEVARQRNRVLGLSENVLNKDSEISDKAHEIASLSAQMSELSQTVEAQRRATDELAEELASKERAISDMHTEIEILRADLSDKRIALTRPANERTNRTALKIQAVRDLSQPAPNMIVANDVDVEFVPVGEATEDSAIIPVEMQAANSDIVSEAEIISAREDGATASQNRFNLDRPFPVSITEATVPLRSPARPEVSRSAVRSVNAVIQEARKTLVENAAEINLETGAAEQGRPSSSVISLAKRLRALQAKSDEKIAKTLK
jgi:cell division protein FtsB